MSALLAAATAGVVAALVGVVAAYLWVTGSLVEHIAIVLAEQVAPGAQAVAGHVGGMAPAIRQLEQAVSTL